jgi:hypothetical protein
MGTWLLPYFASSEARPGLRVFRKGAHDWPSTSSITISGKDPDVWAADGSCCWEKQCLFSDDAEGLKAEKVTLFFGLALKFC